MKKTVFAFILLTLSFMLAAENQEILTCINKQSWETHQQQKPPQLTSDSHILAAHYTPWDDLHDSSRSLFFYNTPLVPAAQTPSGSFRREVQSALKCGIDLFLVDLVGGYGNRVEIAYLQVLEALLKEAKGTRMLVAGCLDFNGRDKDLPNVVKNIEKVVALARKYPNYPMIEGKPVIATYNACRRPAREWKEIRRLLRESGNDIFLIIDLGSWMLKGGLQKEVVDEYTQIADMTYIFEAYGNRVYPMKPGTIERSREQVFQLLHESATARGILTMPTLTPGYCGGWLLNRHNTYQPHFGLDMLLEGMNAYDPRAKWVHITTWNDYVETAMCPTLWDFGTHGDFLRFFKNEIMNGDLPPETDEPRLYFAYLRELLPGSTLRIEAVRLPENKTDPMELSGKLLNTAGETVAELPCLQLSFPHKLERSEWLIPTARLSNNQALIPEITVKQGNFKASRKLPAVLFRNGWIQNNSTVKIPYRILRNPDNVKLTINQTGNELLGHLEFKLPEKVTRATLFRNDLPIGYFQKDEPLLLLNFMINRRDRKKEQVFSFSNAEITALQTMQGIKEKNNRVFTGICG